MKQFLALSVFLALCGLTIVGCGGGSGSTSFSSGGQAGAVYVTGEDAPLPSVVGLNLTISSITLTGKSSSPQLVSSPITVDFARLVGLREPLAFNAVPPDTYSSATFVLSSPVIDYISAVNPPQVTTLNGTFTSPTSTSPQTTSVTVNFPTPMVVGSNGLAGVHTEFDIRRSLAVDGSGQITGQPAIKAKDSVLLADITGHQRNCCRADGYMGDIIIIGCGASAASATRTSPVEVSGSKRMASGRAPRVCTNSRSCELCLTESSSA